MANPASPKPAPKPGDKPTSVREPSNTRPPGDPTPDKPTKPLTGEGDEGENDAQTQGM